MPDEGQEWEAVGLVAAVLRGRVRKTDTGEQPGVHDFEIELSDRTLALEVTSSTVGEVAELWRAVGREDGQPRTSGGSTALGRPGYRLG